MAKLLHIPSTYKGNPHVFIGSLMYDGKVSGTYMEALLKSLPILQSNGIAVDYFTVSENCHVDDARNEVVRSFLKTECTDLLFIDDDVGWEPESIVKILQFDRDIVAGVYPKRSPLDEPEFPVRMEPGKEIWSEEDGLVEVLGAPTGFMRIRRNVLEKMVELNKHRQFLGQNLDKEDNAPYTILFERVLEKGRRLSGDYAFCQKWRDTGGKIYVDPEMTFIHEGNKEWVGKLGDHWKKIHGVQESIAFDIAKKAIEKLKSGESDPKLVSDVAEWWGNKDWAGGLGMSVACLHLGRHAKGRILECGSGLSTIMLSIGGGEVHTIEHDYLWWKRISVAMDKLGLNAIIDYSPIKQYREFLWYDHFPILKDISLLVCDGPPRQIGREGVHLLDDQLKNAIMLFDDATDPSIISLMESYEKKQDRRFIIMNSDKPYAVSKPSTV